MPEIIDIEDPTAQPDPEEVPSLAPAGKRETTYPERIGSVATNIGAGLAGLAEATGENLYNLGTAPLRAVGVMEGDIIPEGYKEAYNQSQSHVAEYLDNDFIDNLGKNIGNLAEGFVTILTSPFNVQEFVPEDSTFFDVVSEQATKAYGTTEDLHEVVLGDMTNLLNPANIFDNAQTRPIDLALVMLPTVRAVKGLTKAGTLKAAASGTKLAPAAKTALKAAEKIDTKLTSLVEPIVRTHTYTKLRRWISDPSAQVTPELERIAKRFLEEPSEVRAKMGAAFEEAAVRILHKEEAGVRTPIHKTKAKRVQRRIGEEGAVEPIDVPDIDIAGATITEIREMAGGGLIDINSIEVAAVYAEVFDNVKRLFKGEGQTFKTADAAAILPRVMEALSDSGFRPAELISIQEAMIEATKPYLARVLETPIGFKQLMHKLKEIEPNRAVRKKIKADLETWIEHNKAARSADNTFPDYQLANGATFDVESTLQSIASKDKVLNATIAEEVLGVVSREVLPQVEKASYKLIVDDLMAGDKGKVFQPKASGPTLRVVGAEGDVVSTIDILTELMGDSKHPVIYSTPDTISKARFTKLQQQLKLNKDYIIEQVAQQTGRPLIDIASEMDDLARHFKMLEPINKDAAQLLGYRPNDIMIPKGLNDTLKWQNKAMNSLYGDSWLAKLNRAIKSNFTVLNPSTHINNIMSNMMVMALRNANPLVFKDMIVNLRKYHNYLKSDKSAPFSGSIDDAITFEALRNTDLINSSMADIDLALTRGKSTGPLPGTKLAAKGYKAGDSIFKVQIFVDEFKKLMNGSRMLESGETMTLLPKRGTKVKITKNADNSFSVDGKVISNNAFEKLLGETASFKAKNILFDYSDVGNYAKMLKSVPALGILSPFYTWFIKSLDIPGFQKGLVSHTVNHTATPWIATNSPKLNAIAAKNEAMLALRRATVVSGLKSQLAGNEDFKEILDWLPKDLGIHLVEASVDPGYGMTRDFRWMNPYEGTYQLLDGLSGAFKNSVDAVADIYTPTSLHLDQTIKEIKADPDISDAEKREIIKTRNWWHRWHSGKGQDMGTLANIMGTAGSYFFDMLDAVKLSEKQGFDFNAGKFSRTLASAMMGGAYSKALRATLGLTDLKEVEVFKQFIGRRTFDPSVQQTSDLRWFVRTLTGQLMRKQDLWKSYDWFFKGLRQEYKKSIIQPIWDRADALEDAGLLEEAARVEAVGEKWLQAINNDLEAIEEEYASQIESLKHKDTN